MRPAARYAQNRLSYGFLFGSLGMAAGLALGAYYGIYYEKLIDRSGRGGKPEIQLLRDVAARGPLIGAGAGFVGSMFVWRLLFPAQPRRKDATAGV